MPRLLFVACCAQGARSIGAARTKANVRGNSTHRQHFYVEHARFRAPTCLPFAIHHLPFAAIAMPATAAPQPTETTTTKQSLFSPHRPAESTGATSLRDWATGRRSQRVKGRGNGKSASQSGTSPSTNFWGRPTRRHHPPEAAPQCSSALGSSGSRVECAVYSVQRTVRV